MLGKGAVEMNNSISGVVGVSVGSTNLNEMSQNVLGLQIISVHRIQ